MCNKRQRVLFTSFTLFTLFTLPAWAVPTAQQLRWLKIDHQGNLWGILSDSNLLNFWFAKYNSNGVAIASTSLPGLTDSVEPRITFDAAGNGIAVGGDGSDMKLYKVEADGGGLLVSATDDTGYADFPMAISSDSLGNFWITGAVAYNVNPPLYKMALWKSSANFNPIAGFPKFHLPPVNGNSLGLDIAVAGNDVWVVGMTSNAATGALNLAVWKYDVNGVLADGFPKIDSGRAYALDIDKTYGVIEVADNAVWVAAGVISNASDKNLDLAFGKLDLNGKQLFQVYWHNTGLKGDDVPFALNRDSQGNFYIAGTYNRNLGGTSRGPALWKYQSNGILAAGYPKTSTSTGYGFHGMAVDNQDKVWVTLAKAANGDMIVSTSPKIFSEGFTVAGALGLDGVAVGPTKVVFVAPSGGPLVPIETIPSAVNKGACSGGIKVQARGGNNLPAAPANAIAINVSDSAGGSFFSDPGCATPIVSVDIPGGPGGHTSLNIFYKKATSGNGTLLAAGPNLNNGSGQAMVVNELGGGNPPAKLSLTVAPSTVTAGVCSSTFTVATQDSGNVTVAVASNTVISLSDGGAGGAFFWGSQCNLAAQVNQLVITAGNQFMNFYYKASLSSATVAVTASASGLTQASKTVVVRAQGGGSIDSVVATKLALFGPDSVPQGVCSATYTVRVQENGGLDVAAPQNVSVLLSDGNMGGYFYAGNDFSCAGTPISDLTINAGTSAKSFFYKKDSGGISVDIKAMALNLVDGVRAVAVTVGNQVIGPAKLAITIQTGQTSLPADTCSPAFNVRTRSDSNVDTPVSSALSVALSDGDDFDNGDFYSDHYCSQAVTQLTIAKNQSQAAFFYKRTSTGAITLSASAQALTSAAYGLDILGVTGPTQLYLSGQTLIDANACSTYTVVSENNNQVQTAVVSTITVYLDDDYLGGTFFANSACTKPVTFISIASGTSSASLYYRKPWGGQVSLYADDGFGGLAGSSLWVTVEGGVSQSTPTHADLQGPMIIPAGVCSPTYMITARDINGQPAQVSSTNTFNLSDAGVGGRFYSDSNCSSEISVASLTASAISFYYKKSTGGVNVVLNAMSAGLGEASMGVSVLAAPQGGTGGQATKLVVFGPINMAQGLCSPAFHVHAQDDANVNINLNSNAVVYLDDNNAGGGFYSDNQCDSPVGNATIYSGFFSAPFFYQAPSSGAVMISADDGVGGLTEAALKVNVNPALAVGGGTVTLSATNVAPASVEAGKAASMLKLTLSAAGGGASISLVDFDLLGTISTSVIAGIQIFEDNGDGIWTHFDMPLGAESAGGSQGKYSFNPPKVIGPEARTFFAALRLLFQAPAGATAGLTIASTTSFVMNSGFMAPGAIYPVSSALATVTAASSGVQDGPDAKPPGQITNLLADSGSEGVVILEWTAPGDDGLFGSAQSYDIRFSSKGPITGANWGASSVYEVIDLGLLPPPPQSGGAPEFFAVTGLDPGVNYWWGVRSLDDTNNISLVSNSPSAKAGEDALDDIQYLDGKGKATIAPAQLPSCQAVISTITFVVDASSISAGGGIVVRVPNDWTLPQTQCPTCPGYVKAVNEAGIAHSSVSLSVDPQGDLGPNWFVAEVLNGKFLSGGATVQFVLKDFWTQWELEEDVPFEVWTQGDSEGAIGAIFPPPSVDVKAGDAAKVGFTSKDHLIVAQGQPSGILTLEAQDFCGHPAAATSAKAVLLAAKRLDPASGQLTSDSQGQFSLTGDFSATVTSVTIPQGQSTASFYYRTQASGKMTIEALPQNPGSGPSAPPAFLHFDVISGSVSFAGLSVDSGQPGNAASVTISPNGDGIADWAFINFVPSHPGIHWQLAISSDNFATIVFERFGSGNPLRSLTWDGRHMKTQTTLPNGDYKVRIRAAGGLASDASLTIRLESAFISGTVTQNGAPVSAAKVIAKGWPMAVCPPSETSANGSYAMYGLKPGVSYHMTAQLPKPGGVSASATAGPVSASLTGGSANLALTSPSQILVMARLPSPSAYDFYGDVSAYNASETNFGHGGIHFAPGATQSDAGGYSFGESFSETASSWTTISVTPDTYTVVMDMWGFAPVEKVVYVGAGKTAEVLFTLVQRANIYGWVRLPEVSVDGAWVAVDATPSGAASPTFWGGAWIPPSYSSAVYSLFGVEDGTYTLRAYAPGFAGVSTGPIVVSGLDLGTPDGGGINFSTFSVGAKIEGTLTVLGNSRKLPGGLLRPSPYPILINAFDPITMLGGYQEVDVSTSDTQATATYRIGGLDAGVLYQVVADLEGFELDPPGSREVTIGAGGSSTLNLTMKPVSGQVRILVTLPSGSTDYKNVGLRIKGPVGELEVNDLTSVTVGTLDVFASSAAFLSPIMPGGFYEINVFYRITRSAQNQTLHVKSGEIAVAAFDLSGAAYTISGSVTVGSDITLNFATYTVTVSSVSGLVANAGMSRIATQFLTVISTPSARIEAFLEDQNNFGKVGAGNVSFDSKGGVSLDRSWSFGRVFFGLIRPDGSYQIQVPPGVYRVRPQANLDGNFANGFEVAPQEKVVVVKSAALSDVNFTLASGVEVSGTLSLPAGTADTRVVGLALLNVKGEPVAFTKVEFQKANSAGFLFSRVPNGDYTIVVKDAGALKAYVAKPKKIKVSGVAVAGQNLDFKPAGSIKGKILIERTKADGTTILTPIAANNKNLLPKGLEIKAVANPWIEGAVFEASKSGGELAIDSNDQFVIEGLLPGTYDVRVKAADGGSGALLTGALILAPQTAAARRVIEGQITDVGSITLKPALAVTGTVKDNNNNPIANILVGASPSHEEGEDFQVAAFTNQEGVYTLAGFSPDIKRYDFVVMPRGVAWERFLKGKKTLPYKTLEKRAIEAKSAVQNKLHFVLESAPGAIRGRLARSANGAALSYPGSSLSDFPAGAVYLQKVGVRAQDNPLGDISVVSEADDGTGANFLASNLESGKYRLTAVSRGYASTGTVVTVGEAEVNIGTLTFAGGGSLTGKITKADGNAPAADEIRFIAAASANFDSFVFGSLVADEQTKLVGEYFFSGFQPGTTYQMMIQGADGLVATPSEAENILFASADESENVDVTWKLPKPAVFSRFSRTSSGAYKLSFNSTQPLRKKKSVDDDLSVIIATTSGNGTLSQRAISSDRKSLTALYTPATAEDSFSVRFKARTSISDPEAADPTDPEFSMDQSFTHLTGLESYGEANINNVEGGEIQVEGDTSKIALQPGSLEVTVSTNVRLTLSKARVLPTGSSSLGRTRAAYPQSLLRAMDAAPAVSAMSAFYEILLPRGLSSRLAKAGKLTISYSTTTVSNPEALNVYWFNEGAKAYFIQNQDRVIDTANHTITVSVGHFSTFVALDAGQQVIRGSSANVTAIEVYNFPNPFNLKSKTLTLNRPNSLGPSSITTDGTVIRFALPSDISGNVKMDIYNVAGEHVRTLEIGEKTGGEYYYVEWDGRNNSGQEVASGVYIGELRIAGKKKFIKMAVIK